MSARTADPTPAEVTMLFVDVVESTPLVASIGDRLWFETVEAFDALVEQEVVRHRGRVTQRQGDQWMAIFDDPRDGLLSSIAVQRRSIGLGLRVRAGVHSGTILLDGDRAFGLEAHIAARVMAVAGSGEIAVSRAVASRRQLGGTFRPQRLRGVPGARWVRVLDVVKGFDDDH